MMPVEFEDDIKRVVLAIEMSMVLASLLHNAGRIYKVCRQNFVSISKTANFVLLPFSNSASIV